MGESPEGIFAATAHDVTPRWRDKRIVSENCLRESFERIRFTSSSELVGETMWILFTCEKFKLPWNRGCLKCVRSVFFFKIKVEINLDFKAKKFMSCELTWNQDVFQNAPEPVFSNHLNTCISIYLSIDRSIDRSIDLSIYLSIYIYIYI